MLNINKTSVNLLQNEFQLQALFYMYSRVAKFNEYFILPTNIPIY